MISSVFNHLFFLPLYNALVWLSSVLPGADIGLAIVVLTLLVKAVLFPLQHRMTKTQLTLKTLEPQLNAIKADYAHDRTEQAKRTMELYRQHGISPFSGFLTLLIQLPILIALVWVFKDSFLIKPEWLYSFVTPPLTAGTHFLGWIDISARNYWLPIVVGLTQFMQMSLVMPPPPESSGKPSLAMDFQRSLSLQMRYFMPLMVVFIGFSLPSALSLYWLTSNLFAIAHELFVTRRLRNQTAS